MKKTINQYSVKQVTTSLKDMDLGKREVAIYLSTFDIIDSDNDLIERGAFLKSINDRGVNSDSNRKIAYLRHHDWQQQIGKFMTLEEDEKGLFAIGKLGTSTKGEDALRDYDEGIITEHSIGFQYISDKIEWVEDESVKGDGYFCIKELKLFEGSAVTFGANEYTEVVSVGKGLEKTKVVEKLSKEIDVVTKALINGRGTDERLYDLEMKLKYLNSRLIDLAIMETDTNSKSATIQQINNEQNFDWRKINKLLN
jgi:HK97 family phage prohead protease